MRLSYAQKQTVYHEFAQLFRAGVPINAALDAMAGESRGTIRRMVDRLRAAVAAHATIAEAFAAVGPCFSGMELGMIAAGNQSGRLEQAFRYLAEYFAALEKARSVIISRSAYPFFVLHFGAFLLALPALVAGGGTGAYLREVGTVLLCLYGGIAVLATIVILLTKAGRASPEMDRALRILPVVGKLRRSLALGRFCAAYEMQLQAGVNIIHSLEAASRASHSALIRRAIARVLPQVAAGSQPGALLQSGDGFSDPLLRALRVGEQTGALDEELVRWAAYYQEDALVCLGKLADRLPRLLYIVILCYLGAKVVTVMKGYYGGIEKMMEQ